MKPLIQFRKTTPLVATVLLLAGFAMRSVPDVSGVLPPPDGGYPGGNTAKGRALFQALPPANTIRRLGSFHSRAWSVGVLTRVLVLVRSLVISATIIPLLALRGF